jgi:hypothetical protein
VWAFSGVINELTCVYDPATKKLTGAAKVTNLGDFTSAECSGAALALSRDCILGRGPYADGGASLCPGGTFMATATMCASTFDAQKNVHPSNAIDVASGACGGYLDWALSTMNYSLTCLYDPTTQSYVGAVLGGDTTTTCNGAGVNLQAACVVPSNVRDAGVGD